VFYLYNGIQYRELYINEDKDGYLFVSSLDKNNKKCTISLAKFKKERDLD
jgi:hypothetical protein